MSNCKYYVLINAKNEKDALNILHVYLRLNNIEHVPISVLINPISETLNQIEDEE
jgi:hypothetical protein